MTVRQLLTSIDSRELTEWQIYEQETGPLGGERLDYLFARLTATLLRVNTVAKEQHKVKDSDHMIQWNDGGSSHGDDS